MLDIPKLRTNLDAVAARLAECDKLIGLSKCTAQEAERKTLYDQYAGFAFAVAAQQPDSLLKASGDLPLRWEPN